MAAKTCTECKESKALSEYAVRKNRPIGHSAKCKQCVRKYYHLTKAERKRTQKAYREKNKNSRKKYMKEYQKNNLHIFKEANNRRRALEKSNVCKCCSKEEMQAFYKECPEGHHVDHIRPLSKGGKHCLKNIQQIPKDLNLSKGTKNIIYLTSKGETLCAL